MIQVTSPTCRKHTTAYRIMFGSGWNVLSRISAQRLCPKMHLGCTRKADKGAFDNAFRLKILEAHLSSLAIVSPLTIVRARNRLRLLTGLEALDRLLLLMMQAMA